MNTDNTFMEFVNKKVSDDIRYYTNNLNENRISEIANEIIKLIDWNNSALMHKGLSWISQNYLRLNKII